MTALAKFPKIVFILTFFISLNAGNFLWQAETENGKGKVFLLGSIHLVPDDLYPLDEKIETSFDISDFLVVEANMNDLDINKTAALMMKKGLFSGGGDLKKVLPEATYKRLETAVGGNGFLGMAQLNMMRPWLVYITLSQLEVLKAGYDPLNGIDMHFLKKAKGKKEIIELESAEYQMELLSSFPDSVQTALIESALDELPEFKEKFDKMIESWKKGDLEAIDKEVSEEFLKKKILKTVHDKLIIERNLNMTAKIETFLNSKDGKNYFVVVGAGHLTGKKGIVSLLKSKGYKVEQH